MATTGAITLSSSTAVAGPPGVLVTLTLTNGGTAAVTVLSGALTISPIGAPAAAGQLPLGPGYPITVNGSSGTLALSTQFVPYAPPANSNASAANTPSLVYTIGALVTMSDGSVVSATTATLTVSPPTVT
jgi:hypothetical protein